jgi:hypothetical protein
MQGQAKAGPITPRQRPRHSRASVAAGMVRVEKVKTHLRGS